MSLLDLLRKNRSYRRFDETYEISQKQLKTLVELTRYVASARNMQPLKYVLVSDPKMCDKVFQHTSWAAYLDAWSGPVKGERPRAYILVLKDTDLANHIFCDDGLAIQSIMLGAVEMGLGGCVLGAFDKAEVCTMLNVPERLQPLYLLALGKPVEHVVLEEVKEGNIKYWRDESEVHHVPKRSIDELIFKP